MRLVEYTYRHPDLGVDTITLAQEGPSDSDWLWPVGVTAWRVESGSTWDRFTLDDEATRIVHPILDRQVLTTQVREVIVGRREE